MITIGSFKDISEEYDEVWLIVRSLKSTPQVSGATKVFHVPDLSPSTKLFHDYLNWRNAGIWNKDTYENQYKPRFLQEMKQPEAVNMLNILKERSKTKNILLVCYCQDENLCHRKIVYDLCCQEEGKKNMRMCFTGRRPKDLFGYDHDSYIPMVEVIKRELRAFIAQGYTEFISGGAQGFDQLAFWAVNALKREDYKIKNIVYVPFQGQEKAWKSTGLFSQAEYNLMLRLADEVKVLRTINTYDKGQVVIAMHDRNHAMVNDTDAVFGLYPDYSWQLLQTKGGTAECLKYASSKGKRIYQLSNETLRGQWIN